MINFILDTIAETSPREWLGHVAACIGATIALSALFVALALIFPLVLS